MKQNRPWYKKWYYYFIALAVVLSGFLPQILDAIYPKNGIWFTETTFKKEDLLAFYGSYLTFIGTAILGALALWQNIKFRQLSNIEKEVSRKNEIRPVFVVKPKVAFSAATSNTDEYGNAICKKGTFQVELINLGKAPILNVFINTKFKMNFWEANQSVLLDGHYENCEMPRNEGSILFDEVPDAESDGFPLSITINYDDYDGNLYYQIYTKYVDESNVYYSLDKIEEC